jgi:aminotransferase
MLPIYSNSLGDEELEAVSRVFASKWLGMGPECSAFEVELGEYWGVPNVLLFNSATAALFISLKALGIGPGDEVICSTINFLGCANAILNVGAKPVFADVDPEGFNIRPEEIIRLKTNKTRAVMILHYGGHPADIDTIKSACGPNIKLIEDAANAIASRRSGAACGTLGDAGVFSFDAMKMLVMGDGGALVLKDPDAFARAKAWRYLGFPDKVRSGVDSLKQGDQRWWEFEVNVPAGRYISNDILAAIGRVQLRKLPGFIARRKQIWEKYQAGFTEVLGLQIPPEPSNGSTSSYYIYWIGVPGLRDNLARHLVAQGIYCTFRYFPLHRIPLYGNQEKLPVADEMNESILNLPIHQNLSDEDVDFIITKVREFISAN